MAYKILLPSKMMKDLWMLREYCGGPPIIQGVRAAVSEWISKRETEIGTSIQDAAEAIAKHKNE